MTYTIQQTADGSATLFSEADQETFHSIFGALTETEYVFIEGTEIIQRFKQGQATRLLEIGFGTGLNFLATARLAYINGVSLHYVALEKTLLSGDLLRQLGYGSLLADEAGLGEVFLAWWETKADPAPSCLTWSFSDQIHLDLILGDASQAPLPLPIYHAIYHDPFSPQVNPTLWTQDFFRKLYEVLAPGGHLATYSAKGRVRRAMQAVGFTVVKRPGPPGKREVVVARRGD